MANVNTIWAFAVQGEKPVVFVDPDQAVLWEVNHLHERLGTGVQFDDVDAMYTASESDEFIADPNDLIARAAREHVIDYASSTWQVSWDGQHVKPLD